MYFMEFIAAWGYVAIAVLMAAANACIPIPSELILGFAGYLIFDGQLGYAAALAVRSLPYGSAEAGPFFMHGRLFRCHCAGRLFGIAAIVISCLIELCGTSCYNEAYGVGLFFGRRIVD